MLFIDASLLHMILTDRNLTFPDIVNAPIAANPAAMPPSSER
jgi:hypothetical protein